MNRSFVRAAACTLAAVAVTAVLLAIPAATPSQAASFTFTDANCSSFNWDGTTLTCVTSGGGGGGALTCSIAASPSNSTTVGTNVTLTANCSGGTSPYTYTWTGGGSGGCPTSGASAQQQALTSPASAVSNCAYTVTARDSAGSPAQANANKNVTWSAAGGGGGGGGGGNIACAGFNATHVISATWTSNGLYYTANVGGFGPGDAVVVKFTTSATTTVSAKGYAQAVEYSDPPTPRYGALSDTACDFTVGLPIVGSADRTVFGTPASGNIAPWSYFTLNMAVSGYPTLQPNTTYYFNIANVPGACGGSCNMQVTVNKPRGS